MPPEYASGQYVFLFIALGRLVDMATGLNGIILVTSKKYWVDLFFTFLLITIAILTNLYFIPRYGMNGAAFATMLITIIYNILRLFFVKWKFNMFPFDRSFIFITIIGLVSLFIITFIPFIYNRYLDITIRSILVCILFILPIWYFNLSTDLSNFANGIIKQILKKPHIKSS